MTSVTPEPSVLLLCAHYSCQWLLLTTSQGKHCHYTHFIDEETKASGEMTCPRSPKTNISLDMELGPHKSSKLHYTTRSSRNTSEGSSPASLPDVSPTRQARLSACSADPLLPGEETVFCLWPGPPAQPNPASNWALSSLLSFRLQRAQG